nr:FkbM family methyltransferase [Wenzhouxiangella sp. XN79A]
MRSLAVYRRPGRQRGLRRMYAPFVPSGGCVFDVGAHVGDRSRAFAALGARVVAVEPQDRFADWLERTLSRHGVVVERCGLDAEPGRAELQVSRAHPTVSTLNREWPRDLAERNAGFSGVAWDRRQTIELTTLDRLIERHGRPDFCKIDVEGCEDRVLAGLGQPLPALSVEFVQGALDVARRCVQRLQILGDYEFNAVAGEQRRFQWPAWRRPGEVLEWLDAGAGGIASGDLYARLRDRAD